MIKHHILYSYRRCPYAMRARMALVVAGIQCQVHEVDFKNKPLEMLSLSPKGTVPVLHTFEGQVIDESLDIMKWALGQNDPLNFFENYDENLIDRNDNKFKLALDRYKYPMRFPDEDCTKAREQGLNFLLELNHTLSSQKNLKSDNGTINDIAIFPFVRQFVNVDKTWFEMQELLYLKRWLVEHLNSELFKKIIQKQKDNPYFLIC